MERRGILVKSAGWKTLAEEADFAYKNVTQVVQTCERAGLSYSTARKWYLKGERHDSQGHVSPYASFFREVNRSQPEATLKHNEQIAKAAAKGDWHASREMTKILAAATEPISEQFHSQMTDADRVRLTLAHPTLGPLFRTQVLDALRAEHGLPSVVESKLFPDTAVGTEVVDAFEKKIMKVGDGS